MLLNVHTVSKIILTPTPTIPIAYTPTLIVFIFISRSIQEIKFQIMALKSNIYFAYQKFMVSYIDLKIKYYK